MYNRKLETHVDKSMARIYSVDLPGRLCLSDAPLSPGCCITRYIDLSLRRLLQSEEFDVEDESSATGNVRGVARGAIAIIRGQDERSSLTNLHSSYSFIPALDDF